MDFLLNYAKAFRSATNPIVDEEDDNDSDIYAYYRDLVDNPWDVGDLEDVTLEVKSQLNGWVKAGLAAAQIKICSLWKEGNYKSFADYCKHRLGRTSWYINRLIDAAQAVLELSAAGNITLPTCEAQVRPLIKAAKGDREKLKSLWAEVVDRYDPAEITANVVAAIAEGRDFDEVKDEGKISKDTLKWAEKLARLAGKTSEEFLRDRLGEWEENLEPPDDFVRPILSTEYQVTPEDIETLDNLDRQFRVQAIKQTHPAKIARDLVQNVDDIFNALLGDIIPKRSGRERSKPLPA